MAIVGNFKIGNKSFAKKSGSAKPQKRDTSGLTGRDAAIAKQFDTRPTQTFDPRSRDAMYASSDDLLQNLIDRKDELKTQSGGQGDDRNLYQVRMNEFINKNPQNQEAYASRFPIQNFMTQGLPNLAKTFMPGAGVLSLLASIGNKIKGGLSRATDMFDGPAVTEPIRQQGPAYDASGLAGYQDAIMRNLPPVRSMNPDDMGIMAAQPDFRFDGPFVPNPDDMMIAPKMTAKDYYDEFMTYTPEEQGLALGMNEGGLASINNPEYNMLMKASDFDV
jgi:hypothetical protein